MEIYKMFDRNDVTIQKTEEAILLPFLAEGSRFTSFDEPEEKLSC
jgi:hypothetical protein